MSMVPGLELSVIIAIFVLLSMSVVLTVLGYLYYRRCSKLIQPMRKTQARLQSRLGSMSRAVDGIKSELKRLEEKVNNQDLIVKELKVLEQRAPAYRTTERERTVEKAQTTGVKVAWPKPREPRKPTLERILEDICRFYNDVVDDRNRQGEFTQRYNPIRIGVANVMDRYRDPGIEPVFQTANDGNYYAVAVEGSTSYAVVPRFDLTLQRSSYGPGAIGQVFDCPNYDPQLNYSNVKVVKPAIFGFDPAKQQREIRKKGELDLGRQASTTTMVRLTAWRM